MVAFAHRYSGRLSDLGIAEAEAFWSTGSCAGGGPTGAVELRGCRVPFVSVDFFAADPQTQPSLNGCLGTILEWDADQERWKVGWNDVHLRLWQMITMLLALYAFFHVGIGLLELGWYSFVSQKSMSMRRKFWQSVKLQSLTVHTKFIPHDGSIGLVYFTYDKFVGPKRLPYKRSPNSSGSWRPKVVVLRTSGSHGWWLWKTLSSKQLGAFPKGTSLGDEDFANDLMTPHDWNGTENLKQHHDLLLWSNL